MRDRDYLMDHHGVVFKVIGDSHPGSHYLGYVKYHPDDKGDRRLFGRTYRQNSVVSKSFGILAARPECYVYSDTLGCVITGIPREDIAVHYSCRQALTAVHEQPGPVADSPVGRDLLAIAGWVLSNGAPGLIGVTGPSSSAATTSAPTSTSSATARAGTRWRRSFSGNPS